MTGIRDRIADYALAFSLWLTEGRICECRVCHEMAFCKRRPTGTWACQACNERIAEMERAAT